MTLRLIVAILAASLTLPAWAGEHSATEVKADSLRFLQDLRKENVKQLTDIDDTIKKKIEEGSDKGLETEVARLKADQKEHMLRQEFLNRLIFQVDANFRGGDLRKFLGDALTDMAKVDAVQSYADTGLWKFMRNAADAVKRLPEQKENILSFLEGYMQKSVSNPVPASEFLSTRNYSNGAKSEQGSPLSRDEVGAIADRRLHELDSVPPQEAKRKAPSSF
jgi:hypothetical protein